MVEKLLAVTSDVKHFPKDDSPYGSLLAGRLASQSVLSAVDIEMLGVFVEMDKDHSHVKMWKAGLKSLEDLDSTSEAKRSSRRRSRRKNASSSRRQAWDGSNK